jgi:hypothetical protein
MKSQECNGGFQPAGWKGRDGKLYFPTTNGAVQIDPARVQRNAQAPTVTLEQATLNGRSGRYQRAGRCSSRPRQSGVSLQRPDFPGPRRSPSATAWKASTREWVEAGSRREAYYTNIPPGNYRFRVIAANEDGVWNEAGVSTAFVLRPHFGQTGYLPRAVFRGVPAGPRGHLSTACARVARPAKGTLVARSGTHARASGTDCRPGPGALATERRPAAHD